MKGPTTTRVELDPETAGTLAAFADTLIPGEDRFPAPSEARIVEDFLCRYIAAGDTTPVYLPGVTLDAVARMVAALGEGFAQAAPQARVDAVAFLERDEPELFAGMQALIYAGYYSRPEVRSAIASSLEAGRDYRRAPQPYGYADVIEPWDESLFSSRGHYIKTEEVKPLDRDRLAGLSSQDREGSSDE